MQTGTLNSLTFQAIRPSDERGDRFNRTDWGSWLGFEQQEPMENLMGARKTISNLARPRGHLAKGVFSREETKR